MKDFFLYQAPVQLNSLEILKWFFLFYIVTVKIRYLYLNCKRSRDRIYRYS